MADDLDVEINVLYLILTKTWEQSLRSAVLDSIWRITCGWEYSGNSELVILVKTIRHNRRWRLNMQMSLHHLVSRKDEFYMCDSFVYYWFPIKATTSLSIKAKFSFVSRCNHVWCISRRFDCILLVFFRWWSRLVMHYLKV